ncbi:MAG TPA: C4-dicarboxylate transporter DctA [Candidatus Acidoferrales bacterium]|jgi:aerobic C4-dicarboxylate transport protein|nr:C4-dicarboxylate transporter DctA [Candidatus Acidoferrales bacterium]
MPARKPWYKILYLQVLLAVAAGIVVGWLFPDWGTSLKPLGDGFIKLVKMLIGPIIFCTVVHGIASMGDLKKLGRTGLKALLYFEVVSTIALVIGLVVVNVLQPGAGLTPLGGTFHADASAADAGHSYSDKAHALSATEFVLNIIPNTLFSAFVSGDLLQVLLVAALVAFAIAGMGERGQLLLRGIEYGAQVFFGVMHIVVKAAPIGAFGAMAYTVGAHGVGTLNKLMLLMAGIYLTSGLFIILVLGSIAWWCGFSIFRLLAYLKDELFLILGTSSSEPALPGLIEKMQRLGCSKATVGLVVPTGYSFNLDGTNIYMAMAAVFLAQATNTPMTLGAQIYLLLIAMITSKGASGVTGAGFITLAATLQAVPGIPVESLALLVGIDRFMSECRALTNFIGNSVATVVLSRWEKELSPETLNRNLQLARTGNLPPA